MWRASHAGTRGCRKACAPSRERFDLRPLAIHVNYLVNLATLDPGDARELGGVVSRRTGSRGGHRGRVSGASSGNYKDRSLEQGMAAFVLGLAEAAEGFQARG